ncbi:MAG: hypothetical protein JW797_06185 [Bradymonadales bacterium]|nr:hypothetical protein [Bradymonadales bacterium]
MAFTRRVRATCPLLLLLLTGCSSGGEDIQDCTDAAQCDPGQSCIDGVCVDQAGDLDSGLRRDLPGDAPDSADQPQDLEPADLDVGDSGEGGAEPDLAADGEPLESDASGDTAEAGDPVEDTDPLAGLSPQCAGFCQALCDFLEECGKHDPTCLVRCGQSTRIQQLSAGACSEGAHVIGLEDCRLWLDCGGQSCAIDEMCLEIIPRFSYQCAPLCDHTQAQPACPAGADCSTVADAAGSIMSSLGMCWSLF